jgi:microcystin-dependent protein
VSTTEDTSTRPEDPGRPLSEDEKSLLKRILAEPLEFPIEFRSWLKNFFETSGIILPRSSISGYSGTGVRFDDFPPGVIMAWAGSTLPSACLPCNGAAVTRAFYKDLFDAIGTTWGVGDGTTTFNVPDLRDRALYGAGSKVLLGKTDNGAYGTRGPSHYHTMNNAGYHGHSLSIDGVGDHSHAYDRAYGVALPIQNAADGNANVVGITGGGTGGAGSHSHGGSTSGDGDHKHVVDGGGLANTPAYAGVQYVVTTGRTA